MCTSAPKLPAPPIPPPERADYAARRKKSQRPAPGLGPTILTSPLGLTDTATTSKVTLLGQ